LCLSRKVWLRRYPLQNLFRPTFDNKAILYLFTNLHLPYFKNDIILLVTCLGTNYEGKLFITKFDSKFITVWSNIYTSGTANPDTDNKTTIQTSKHTNYSMFSSFSIHRNYEYAWSILQKYAQRVQEEYCLVLLSNSNNIILNLIKIYNNSFKNWRL